MQWQKLSSVRTPFLVGAAKWWLCMNIRNRSHNPRWLVRRRQVLWPSLARNLEQMQRQLARALPQRDACVPKAARCPLVDMCYAEGFTELEDGMSPDPVDAQESYYIRFLVAEKQRQSRDAASDFPFQAPDWNLSERHNWQGRLETAALCSRAPPGEPQRSPAEVCLASLGPARPLSVPAARAAAVRETSPAGTCKAVRHCEVAQEAVVMPNRLPLGKATYSFPAQGVGGNNADL